MTAQEIIDRISGDMKNNNITAARTRTANILMSKSFSKEDISKYGMVIEKLSANYPNMFEKYSGSPELIAQSKTQFTANDFINAVTNLKINFCKERFNDAVRIGEAVYGNTANQKTQTEHISKPMSVTNTANYRANSASGGNVKDTAKVKTASVGNASDAAKVKTASVGNASDAAKVKTSSGGNASDTANAKKAAGENTNRTNSNQNNYTRPEYKKNVQPSSFIPLAAGAAAAIGAVIWLLKSIFK